MVGGNSAEKELISVKRARKKEKVGKEVMPLGGKVRGPSPTARGGGPPN